MVHQKTSFNPAASAHGSLAPPLPDFAVIGAMRAGTTLLYDLLLLINATCLPHMKETDYFISQKNHPRGPAWYARQFQTKAPSPDHGPVLRGDISPNYAKRDAFPDVAACLHAANPEAKLIYIVRDPVARAISQYNHSFLTGQNMPPPESLVGSPVGQHILATSRYAWQLEPWQALFPEKNILIVDFDELTTQTLETLTDIMDFLGLAMPPNFDLPTHAVNSTNTLTDMPGWWRKLRHTKSGDTLRARLPRPLIRTAKRLFFQPRQTSIPAPSIPPSVRQQLVEKLADDAHRFRGLTGKPFNKWAV